MISIKVDLAWTEASQRLFTKTAWLLHLITNETLRTDIVKMKIPCRVNSSDEPEA